MLWVPIKAFGSRFQKVLLKEGHLSDTASAWRQQRKLAATKRRTETRGLQHWPLTPESELLLGHGGIQDTMCLLNSCGDRGSPEVWLSNSSGSREPRSSAQAPSLPESDPDPLKLDDQPGLSRVATV